MKLHHQAGSLEELRAMLADLQQNHTDIQRLWKSIPNAGFMVPAGIQPLPGESSISSTSSSSSSSATSETSSSYSSSSSSSSSSSVYITCSDCDIPSVITMTVSGMSGPFDPINGTKSLVYDSINDRWVSSCETAEEVGFYGNSFRFEVECVPLTGIVVKVRIFQSFDCSPSPSFGSSGIGDIESCNPLLITGTMGTGYSAGSFEVTE